VVVTWTVAEAQALADVLTPGMPSTSWKPYAHRWTSYEGQLKGRSPAREAEGRWASEIYKRYGYWTSLGSAIATWAALANLN
jgi:hypothetical protein